MTDSSDRAGRPAPQDDARIVISGLDDGEAGSEKATEDASNVSPTDEAVERLQSQRDRGEPEDEDG